MALTRKQRSMLLISDQNEDQDEDSGHSGSCWQLEIGNMKLIR